MKEERLKQSTKLHGGNIRPVCVFQKRLGMDHARWGPLWQGAL